MKKYQSPAMLLVSFEATDVIMASDGNETAKDYVNLDNLTVTGIENL